MQDGDVAYLAPEYREMLEGGQAGPPQPSSGAGSGAGGAGGGQGLGRSSSGGGGGGADGGGDGGDGRGWHLAAAEESFRSLLRDWARLGGSGGGAGGGGTSGGGLKARLQGLDGLLARAGDAGAALEDVVAFMRGG
jgi:hypothetical protein